MRNPTDQCFSVYLLSNVLSNAGETRGQQASKAQEIETVHRKLIAIELTMGTDYFPWPDRSTVNSKRNYEADRPPPPAMDDRKVDRRAAGPNYSCY